MHPDLTPAIVTRFWAKVDTSAGLFGCWLWTASLNKHGYGKFALRKERTPHGPHVVLIAAHRCSYILANGLIPDGLWVLHNCPGGDNRRCVNPAHLWLGDAAANNRDALAKGRRVPARGETQGNAKLTEASVIALRRQYAEGMSITALAGLYGVTRGTMSSVVHGRLWPHVGGAQPTPARGHRREPASLCGEKNPFAKLTTQDVRAIRTQAAAGESARTLGSLYGVGANTIRYIVRGRWWKHVE